MGRLGLKFPTLLVQVDLGLSKPQGLPYFTRCVAEGFGLQAEDILIELYGGRDVRHGQYKMVKCEHRRHRDILRHLSLLRYLNAMNNAAPVEECQSDPLDVARANALLVSLGRPPTLTEGSTLPPFFHHLFFWTPHPPDKLGRDGHPKVGGLIPDLGLPRRMWAGGRLAFHAPLRAGTPAIKRSICARHVRKEGRTGPLAFVTLRHHITQGDTLCLTEHQDLVYRADPVVDAPRPIAPKVTRDARERREMRFNQTLLFRYSALTFNGHRIHYDEAYARDVEGYNGLIVHGPLLAQWLMIMATENLGTLSAFSFRATAPVMHHETVWLCQDGTDLWVEGPEERLCMTATAEVM